MKFSIFRLLTAILIVATNQGCAVITVADAAITVGAVAVKGAATVAGVAVDVAAAGVRAAIPDDEDEDGED